MLSRAGVNSCNCPCFIQAHSGGWQQLCAKDTCTNLPNPACALTAAAALPSLPRRLLSTVRERGMQDILPEALRQQYDLGSWLEDVQEVHRPTSEQQYKRACKGIAMRVRGASALACVRARMLACVCRSPCCWTAGPAACGTLCFSLLWPMSCWQFKLLGSHTLSSVL